MAEHIGETDTEVVRERDLRDPHWDSNSEGYGLNTKCPLGPHS